jgi:hypothetical protein
MLETLSLTSPDPSDMDCLLKKLFVSFLLFTFLFLILFSPLRLSKLTSTRLESRSYRNPKELRLYRPQTERSMFDHAGTLKSRLFSIHLISAI